VTDEQAVVVLAREARDRAGRLGGDATAERSAALEAFADMLERVVQGEAEPGAASRDQLSGEISGAYLRGGFPDGDLWRRAERGQLSSSDRLVEHMLARTSVHGDGP
jgi:hypothetical protein